VDAHRDAAQRPTADRLIEELADDRVDGDLSRLADPGRRLDVEVDANLVRGAELP
jgi:hypothetical protein